MLQNPSCLFDPLSTQSPKSLLLLCLNSKPHGMTFKDLNNMFPGPVFLVSSPTTVPQEPSVADGCQPFLKCRRPCASKEVRDNAVPLLCCWFIYSGWWVFCMHARMCTCVPVQKGRKRASESLELWMVVSHVWHLTVTEAAGQCLSSQASSSSLTCALSPVVSF